MSGHCSYAVVVQRQLFVRFKMAPKNSCHYGQVVVIILKIMYLGAEV